MKAWRSLVFPFEVLLMALSFFFAFLLRFNLVLSGSDWNVFVKSLPVVLLAKITAWALVRPSRGMWRYFSLSDAKRITLFIFVADVFAAFVVNMWDRNNGVPRSVWIIDPLVLIVLMIAPRILRRYAHEHKTSNQTLESFSQNGAKAPQRVIMVGAGAAGSAFLKSPTQRLQIVGIVDDDRSKHGRFLEGIKILDSLQNLPDVIKNYSADAVIYAIPSASLLFKKEVFRLCRLAGLNELYEIPTLQDLLLGKVRIDHLKRIEVQDIVQRPLLEAKSAESKKCIEGITVLVTGAGGSIGSELCRQIAQMNPSRIVFVELSEYFLYKIEQEFSSHTHFSKVKVTALIGDIKDAARMNQILKKYKPLVVFHVAAYKHVPLLEEENAYAAINNNAFGTLTLLGECEAAEVGHLVMISTDKAVNPTSIMGATKRLAELICLSFPKGKLKISVVRFGNVLESHGSVIPLFRSQINQGGPITLTHPDVTRYFMSIPEAVNLIIESLVLGEDRKIYILDMGESVKIIELARKMIELSGFRESDIAINTIGLRPGEKLYEELHSEKENAEPTSNSKIMCVSPEIPAVEWFQNITSLLEPLLKSPNTQQSDLIAFLKDNVEFQYDPGTAPKLKVAKGEKALPLGAVLSGLE